ncbi:hypothetical protein [Thiocystis violascens]|uniref:Uncharacterized protein n=1 Tax=Thiocystis violascens (strain ATCC 17096 / DSM 198 / 6111) TaxID=765911 RepID=I3YFT1_THIV6|nr:hypothetical protein [Thiocystis violascens]AFL75849.1 hypothetical protein Thivi_4015 [Thiocystis violascens DSM 198]
MQGNNNVPRADHRQTATDYLQAEDNNPRIRMAEWGFKVLFRFFSIAATLLGMLSFRRDRA